MAKKRAKAIKSPFAWKLHKGRNKLYREAIERDRGCYQAVMQKCYYIAGPNGSSDFIADIIVSNDVRGEQIARTIAAAGEMFDVLDAMFRLRAQSCGDAMEDSLNDAELMGAAWEIVRRLRCGGKSIAMPEFDW